MRRRTIEVTPDMRERRARTVRQPNVTPTLRVPLVDFDFRLVLMGRMRTNGNQAQAK